MRAIHDVNLMRRFPENGVEWLGNTGTRKKSVFLSHDYTILIIQLYLVLFVLTCHNH